MVVITEFKSNRVNNMSDICKNCSTPISGKYCSNCGQSTTTERINFHYIIHEIQHSVFHVDRGILYTIKELITRPGESIREYLSGKRITHFKPFSFILILGTIYGFICFFLKVYPENSFAYLQTDAAANNYSQLVFDWMYGHYSFVMLAFIPFYALASYIVFKKSGYNFVEFLVISSYIVGMQILILILTYPIYYFTLSVWVVMLIFLFCYLYHFWVYIQLFGKDSRINTVCKTLVSMVLSFLFVVIASFLVTFGLIFINSR